MRNHARLLPFPGSVHGHYPQRQADPRTGWQRLEQLFEGLFDEPALVRRRGRFARSVIARSASIPASDSVHFAQRLRDARAQLGRWGLTEPLLEEAFALIARGCSDTLGLQPRTSQLIAARVMLDGRLAEMATGEGKTLAAAFAAAAGALAGIPVHVITANEYLAGRDAAELGPLYERLGLTVSATAHDDATERRRSAYRCDIVYSTARNLVFDYLRDRRSGAAPALAAPHAAAPGPGRAAPLLRGLCMAIVDEADAVLIDEALTPFVLAEPLADPDHLQACAHAISLARRWRALVDFRLNGSLRKSALTTRGRRRLDREAAPLGGIWTHRGCREELLELALTALHQYHRDVDYVVRDDRVQIVDPTTGRVTPGRSWSRGLHQLIELKEGCTTTDPQRTVAQLTYQRFFPRYVRLGGMSGTLRESRRELIALFGLQIETVPLHRPSRRRVSPPRLFEGDAQRWQAVLSRIRHHHTRGRPVLVGTDSVSDSEHLSRMLTESGLPHEVLNAHQDWQEAELIARAGLAGRITVATNMAGRGTDIRITPDVAARGGLQVLCCQLNASRRIDRQLQGRCARCGDPGGVETFLSLQQRLLRSGLGKSARLLFGVNRMTGDKDASMIRRAAGSAPSLKPWLARLLIWIVQVRHEQADRMRRVHMLRADERMDKQLSFGGPSE